MQQSLNSMQKSDSKRQTDRNGQTVPNRQSDFRVFVDYGLIKEHKFARCGHQGKRWRKHSFRIKSNNFPFRISLSAKRGSGPTDVIAVDDLRFENCGIETLENRPCMELDRFTCPEGDFFDTKDRSKKPTCIHMTYVCDFQINCRNGEDEDPAICGKMPANSRCDFDENQCGFHSIVRGKDEFEWRRIRGPTPNFGSNTGPYRDHSHIYESWATSINRAQAGEQGYYMYFDASRAFAQNGMITHGRLESIEYPAPPPANSDKASPFFNLCYFMFWYHMYGNHAGYFTIAAMEGQTSSSSAQRVEVVQTLGGRNVWTRYVIPLAKYNFANSFKFQFYAQAGIGPIGDIGIDDISFSPECFDEGVFNEYPQFKQSMLRDVRGN